MQEALDNIERREQGSRLWFKLAVVRSDGKDSVLPGMFVKLPSTPGRRISLEPRCYRSKRPPPRSWSSPYTLPRHRSCLQKRRYWSASDNGLTYRRFLIPCTDADLEQHEVMLQEEARCTGCLDLQLHGPEDMLTACTCGAFFCKDCQNRTACPHFEDTHIAPAVLHDHDSALSHLNSASPCQCHCCRHRQRSCYRDMEREGHAVELRIPASERDPPERWRMGLHTNSLWYEQWAFCVCDQSMACTCCMNPIGPHASQPA